MVRKWSKGAINGFFRAKLASLEPKLCGYTTAVDNTQYVHAVMALAPKGSRDVAAGEVQLGVSRAKRNPWNGTSKTLSPPRQGRRCSGTQVRRYRGDSSTKVLRPIRGEEYHRDRTPRVPLVRSWRTRFTRWLQPSAPQGLKQLALAFSVKHFRSAGRTRRGQAQGSTGGVLALH